MIVLHNYRGNSSQDNDLLILFLLNTLQLADRPFALIHGRGMTRLKLRAKDERRPHEKGSHKKDAVLNYSAAPP